MILREEQTALQDKVIVDLRAVLKTGARRVMVQGSTGFGKTAVAKSIIRGGREKGSNVVFTVPMISLINQTARSFWDDGLKDFGIMQADHEMTDPTQPIQICSIDTLRSRNERPMATFVIVDEGHRNSEFLWKWMREWPKTIFIGLSATPWTKGLGTHYQALVKGPTTQELINLGLLSDFEVYAPDHPDLSGVSKTTSQHGPDFNQIELAVAMNKDPLIANIVKTWKHLAESRPTIAYCVDRAHAKKVQNQFIAAGVPWGYIDAYTDIDERDEIQAALDTRQIFGVSNVGCLTMGIDWDVRCIIFARPIRSEMLFVQVGGRGLRTAPGKDYCIARDSRVLTDKGLVEIQDITLDHKVWDGVGFVSHKGAVCRGVQPVITWDGLTATPDHKVMTEHGWIEHGAAFSNSIRITQTGSGRQPVRFSEDHFSKNRWVGGLAQSRSDLRTMRAYSHGEVPQYTETPKNEGLPALQRTDTGDGTAMALPEMPVTTVQMPKSKGCGIRQVRGERDQVPVQDPQCSGQVDSREYRDTIRSAEMATGPYQERQALQGWQYPVGKPCGKSKQHPEGQGARSVHCLPGDVSRSKVRRRNIEAVHTHRIVGSRDPRSLGPAVQQAQREVWDILNAGPLQRFTVDGKLVSNCLFLDHSDTHDTLGNITDIDHYTLDDGTGNVSNSDGAPEEKKPKNCPSCGYLKDVGVHVCPKCGFAPEKQSNIEPIEGKLSKRERDRRTKAELQTQEGIDQTYAMALHIASEQGKKRGWAYFITKDRCSVKGEEWSGPSDDWPVPIPPDNDMINFVKYRAIRYAKRRRS